VSDIDKDKPSEDSVGSYASGNAAEQTASPEEDDPASDLADAPHGKLAADAAAHLARSGYSIEGFGANPQEIDRQAGCLLDWARNKRLILTEAYTAGLLRHPATTAEHEVFYRASDNRAVKRTYAGTFGVTPEAKGIQRAATPLFYLRRLELMNRMFDSDLRLEGIALGKSLLIGAKGERPSVVISQPWIRAADANRPHPSMIEIAAFMVSLGFSSVPSSYYGWHHQENRITILDARPDNFIKSVEGVVPIDLVICEE